jgi:hypothetical protein
MLLQLLSRLRQIAMTSKSESGKPKLSPETAKAKLSEVLRRYGIDKRGLIEESSDSLPLKRRRDRKPSLARIEPSPTNVGDGHQPGAPLLDPPLLFDWDNYSRIQQPASPGKTSPARGVSQLKHYDPWTQEHEETGTFYYLVRIAECANMLLCEIEAVSAQAGALQIKKNLNVMECHHITLESAQRLWSVTDSKRVAGADGLLGEGVAFDDLDL